MDKWLGKAESIADKAKKLVPSGAQKLFKAPNETPGDKPWFNKVVSKAGYAVVGLRDDQDANATLDKDVHGALKAVTEANPKFEKMIGQAYGYAVFPAVGRASLVLGGSLGKGEVFEQGKLIGYARIVQVTLGVQLGGETLTVVVVFADEDGLNRFKQRKVSFAANASAVLIKAGAGVTNQYQGDQVFVFSEGGLQIEAAIGVQTFVYRPAALMQGEATKAERDQAASQAMPPH